MKINIGLIKYVTKMITEGKLSIKEITELKDIQKEAEQLIQKRTL